MHQRIAKIKSLAAVILTVMTVLLAVISFFFQKNDIMSWILLAAAVVLVIWMISRYDKVIDDQSNDLKEILGSSSSEAFLRAGMGIVIYDDDFVITFMNEIFKARGIERTGHRLLNWIPEAEEVISGEKDSTRIQLDDRMYEVTRKNDESLLYFKDITDLDRLQKTYNSEQAVLGLASFDNLEESTLYADDADTAAINAAVRIPLQEYCEEYGILSRRLSNNRYLLVLDEQSFAKIAKDRFSILERVRKASSSIDTSITLSMAFARGTSDYRQLDEMMTKCLDLAVSRGGDQVAVQKYGMDVEYFGGSTEAAEKRSRVRVRVMAHALRNLIQRSSNVIICGHKNADFDCIGSAICLARMAEALHTPSCIIAKTGGIEEKLMAAMKKNAAELSEEVNFVTEAEALNQLQSNTLVIMTDHHNVNQSNGAKVEAAAEKVVVIDHHRRSTEMGIKPIMVYIEAAASSACELLTEMLPYISNKIDISALDATFMLTGMIIDTRRWKERTGSRTYDAASALRKLGADPQKAYEYLQDSYDEFAAKNDIFNRGRQVGHGVVVSTVTDRQVTRSMMSQVADTLLGIEGIEAAFVIASDKPREACISARSNGKVNVQIIMEAMKGGGHMTAAATQRSDTDVAGLEDELLQVLDDYFEKGVTHESDS